MIAIRGLIVFIREGKRTNVLVANLAPISSEVPEEFEEFVDAAGITFHL